MISKNQKKQDHHLSHKHPKKELVYVDKDLKWKGHFTYRMGKRLVIGSISILLPPILHLSHRKYKEKLHHFVVDLSLAIVIWMFIVGNLLLAAWIYSEFIWPNIDVKIELAETDVVSGEKIEYKILIENKYKDLDIVEVKIKFPEDFVFQESNIESDNPDGDQYSLYTLESNEQREIIIQGRMFGQIGEQKEISAIIDYVYNRRLYDQFIRKRFNIDSSKISFEIDSEENTISGQDLIWQIKVKNQSDEDLENVKIEFEELPTNFIISDSNIELVNNSFVISNLLSGEEQIIDITSNINSIDKELKLKLISNLYFNEVYYNQESKEINFSIFHPSIVVSGDLLGQDSVILKLGDSLIYNWQIRNTGDIDLLSINASFNVNSILFDYSTVNAGSGIFDGSRVVWNIDSIKAGETKNIQLKINLKQSNPGVDLTKVYIADKLNVNAEPKDFKDMKISANSNELIARVGGEFSISVYAAYYNNYGGQVGYGSNPPMPGEITAYRIYWQLDDIESNLNNLQVITTLPGQVNWTDNISVTAGDAITYDLGSRKVTWHVNKIRSDKKQATASFEVQVLPNAEQIGKKINLINTSSVYINNNLIKQIGPILTDNFVVEY